MRSKTLLQRLVMAGALAIITMTLIAGGWRISQLMGGMARASASEAPFVTIIVSKGDTLWQLARAYGPAGVDIRATIDAIRTVNDLRNAQLQPGTELQIPTRI